MFRLALLIPAALAAPSALVPGDTSTTLSVMCKDEADSLVASMSESMGHPELTSCAEVVKQGVCQKSLLVMKTCAESCGACTGEAQTQTSLAAAKHSHRPHSHHPHRPHSHQPNFAPYPRSWCFGYYQYRKTIGGRGGSEVCLEATSGCVDRAMYQCGKSSKCNEIWSMETSRGMAVIAGRYDDNRVLEGNKKKTLGARQWVKQKTKACVADQDPAGRYAGIPMYRP